MVAHLLKQSSVDCSAFLGGISKNYDSNLLLGESRYTVMEADEFDRSFHRLSPLMAIITSMDADHLDIYGDRETMVEAYNIFVAKIRKGGKLVVNSRIRGEVIVPEGISCFTYGKDAAADYRAYDIRNRGDHYLFSIKTPDSTIEDLRFAFPRYCKHRKLHGCDINCIDVRSYRNRDQESCPAVPGCEKEI